MPLTLHALTLGRPPLFPYSCLSLVLLSPLSSLSFLCLSFLPSPHSLSCPLSLSHHPLAPIPPGLRLAKLDVPEWGKAAAAVAAVAVVPSTPLDEAAALGEKCHQGDAIACDTLSREEEAKRAWLARLGAPAWGMAEARDGGEGAELSPPGGSPPPAAVPARRRSWQDLSDSERATAASLGFEQWSWDQVTGLEDGSG